MGKKIAASTFRHRRGERLTKQASNHPLHTPIWKVISRLGNSLVFTDFPARGPSTPLILCAGMCHRQRHSVPRRSPFQLLNTSRFFFTSMFGWKPYTDHFSMLLHFDVRMETIIYNMISVPFSSVYFNPLFHDFFIFL